MTVIMVIPTQVQPMGSVLWGKALVELAKSSVKPWVATHHVNSSQVKSQNPSSWFTLKLSDFCDVFFCWWCFRSFMCLYSCGGEVYCGGAGEIDLKVNTQNAKLELQCKKGR